MYSLKFTTRFVLVLFLACVLAQDASARTVQYHSEDIVPSMPK